jgi:hypothetical protein
MPAHAGRQAGHHRHRRCPPSALECSRLARAILARTLAPRTAREGNRVKQAYGMGHQKTPTDAKSVCTLFNVQSASLIFSALLRQRGTWVAALCRHHSSSGKRRCGRRSHFGRCAGKRMTYVVGDQSHPRERDEQAAALIGIRPHRTRRRLIYHPERNWRTRKDSNLQPPDS